MRTIFMIGDSIMQNNKADTYPQTGWGQVLYRFVEDGINIVNLAKNGTSTKSFIEQGRFKYVEENIKKDDVLIIGFAHNDEKSNDPKRYTEPFGSFQNNLKYFIDVALNHGATPILCTPVIRRKFVDNKLQLTHGEYVSSIIKLARKMNVSYVDLHKMTYDFYQKLGDEKSKRYFMNFKGGIYDNFPNGNNDDSHQRMDGAMLIASLFVKSIYEQDLKIKKLFIPPNKLICCAGSTYEL